MIEKQGGHSLASHRGTRVSMKTRGWAGLASVLVLGMASVGACSASSGSEHGDDAVTGGSAAAGSPNTGAVASSGGVSAGVGGTPSTGDGGNAGAGTGGFSGFLPAFCDDRKTAPDAGQWQTKRVYFEGDKLQYPADDEQNRIVDFSYAGYRYGEEPLPEAEDVEQVSPVDGDDTQSIQSAIDRVAALPLDERGMRGAVKLAAGTYQVSGVIRVNADGVVLRGSGNGADESEDTILQISGNTPSARTGVVLGTGDGSPWDRGTGVPITTEFVQVGSKSFEVEDVSAFVVGDEVVVRHPSSQAWLDAIDGGDTGSDPAWTAGSKDLIWVRRVVSISGSELTLDAPIFNHLDSALTTSVVHPISNKNTRSRVGLEDLRVDIQTAGGEDEAHAADAVGVVGAEDSWVRNVVTLHFTHAGIFTSGALRITVRDSVAIEPVGVRTGGRFYNFDAEGQSQLVLFTECEARDGRHNMISNGTQTTSGIVFHRIHSEGAGSDSEGHRQWSQALLFDNVHGDSAGDVQLITRGDWGTGHGWASAHSVIWSNTGVSRAQKPPTAQNYAFSSVGTFSTNNPFPGPTGEYEVKSDGDLFPESLYEAQLCERLSQL
jgi:hypothetical protein